MDTIKLEAKLNTRQKFSLKRKQIMRKANISEDSLQELQLNTLQLSMEESKERLIVNNDILEGLEELKVEEPELEVIDEMIDRQKDTLKFNVEDTIRQKEEFTKLVLLSKLRKAGVDDPQAYMDKTLQNKMKVDSSKQKDDTATTEIIKEMSKDNDERYVFEKDGKIRKANIKKALRKHIKKATKHSPDDKKTKKKNNPY
jgi:hypothetical protein